MRKCDDQLQREWLCGLFEPASLGPWPRRPTEGTRTAEPPVPRMDSACRRPAQLCPGLLSCSSRRVMISQPLYRSAPRSSGQLQRECSSSTLTPSRAFRKHARRSISNPLMQLNGVCRWENDANEMRRRARSMRVQARPARAVLLLSEQCSQHAQLA